MSDFKGTPGVWEHTLSDSMVEGEDAWLIVAPETGDVAEITSPTEFAEADARLVAAAPSLLAVAELARETAVTILGEVHSGNASDSLRETLRAWAQDLFHKATDAIAKAKGT